MQSSHPQRRRLVFAAVPIVILAAMRPGTAKAQQSTDLKETDSEAVSFEYAADASKVDAAKSPMFKPGRFCANCNLFIAQAGAPTGGCQLFMGKDVAAIGWCNAWEAKAK